MINRTIGLVATGAIGLFIGYCFYFDKKRRSDPDYKKKILERRKRQLEEEEKKELFDLDFNDPIALQRFFLQELELGEESLRSGEIEESVEHFCRAISVCPSPDQLIQTLQQTLPQPIFLMILQKIPEVSRRMQKSKKPTKLRIKPQEPVFEPTLIDDDLGLE